MKVFLVTAVGISMASGVVCAQTHEYSSDSASYNTTIQMDKSGAGISRKGERISLEDDGGSGMYIVPKIGLNLIPDTGYVTTLGTVNASADTGISLGLSIGKEISDSFAIELDVGYLHNSVSSIDILGIAATQVSVDFEQIPILLNAIWSNSSHKSKPYFGLGVGTVRGELTGNFTAGGVPLFIIPDSEWAFSFQVMAGMSFPISDSSDLTIGYRFMQVNYDDADVNNHTIQCGIEFRF